MARTAKSAGRRAGTNGSSNGSYRLFEDVLSLAGSFAGSRKDYGAEKLGVIAESAREFAASLSDMPNLQQQADSIAGSIEDLAEYVMNTDIEQIAEDAANFARRHPMATIAATVVVGMAASRWLRPHHIVSATSSVRRAASGKSQGSRGRKRAAPARPDSGEAASRVSA